VTGTAAWVARTDSSSIDVGLDQREALALARDLIARLRKGEVNARGISLDDGALDVLHAAIEVIASDGVVDADGSLQDAATLYQLISAADWPESSIEERTELLGACSLWAWRLARNAGKPGLADTWARRAAVGAPSKQLHGYRTDPRDAHGFKTDPRATIELEIGDPRILLALCGELRDRLETCPEECLSAAELFCRFVETQERSFGLHDEREYFLGELALIAGVACRLLGRRDPAERWFNRSEVSFRATVNALADWSRLSYQRLALWTEERRFDEVMELLPALVDVFQKLDMREDALKCGFLEGIVLTETARLGEGIQKYKLLFQEAQDLGKGRLAASASHNLVQLYGLTGDEQAALNETRVALPLLREHQNRVGFAKLQWGLGALLRTKGRFREAIAANRTAQDEFRTLGIRSDVAALNLVIADLLLELGEDLAAVAEVLEALPILQEERMVEEGNAALVLLRQSLQEKRVDRHALRSLQGYFDEISMCGVRPLRSAGGSGEGSTE
jgi:tetratricopeptide (TPR) repeat protein